MKHLINVSLNMLAALVVSMSFVACGSDDSPIDGYKFSDLVFEAEQSFQEIKFPGQDMSAVVGTTSANWCQAYPYNDCLRVVVLENTTYEERTATVTFTDTDKGGTATFRITQKQNNAIIFDTDAHEVDSRGNCLVSVPTEGGNVTIKYQTNVQLEEFLPDVDWITSGTRGLWESETSFSVAPNTSGDKRTAIIMVKNQEGTLTGNIIVTQDAKPYISLETDVLTVDSEGGSYTLNFSSNINLVVETVGLQPWVTQLGITPLGGYNYTLSVVIAPLPAGSDSRTCELSFHRENDFSFLKTLTILQRPSE